MSALIPIDDRFERVVDALDDPAERSSLESLLPGYLRAQRWFGGASRAISATTLVGWADLGLDVDAALCIVTASDGSGYETTHQLYLGVVADESGPPAIFDALEQDEVRDFLVRAVLEGRIVEGYGVALEGEPVPETEAVWLAGESRVLGGEQTNTSIIYEDTCMAKVYRQLRTGTNPDIELLHALAEAGFEAVPGYLGRATVTGPGGEVADAVLLERFVHNEGTGWEWTVRHARAEMAASTTPAEVVEHLRSESLDVRAGELGTITARLHRALAGLQGPGLDAQDVTPESIEALTASLRAEAAVTAELAYHSSFTAPQLDAALERLQQVEVPAAAIGGRLIRVHGDYHLGQLLVEASGFVVIDFEGEPARPLDERRALQHPLVDVAGMLRSFDYAATTAMREADVPAGFDTAWRDVMREAFLSAYWVEALAADPPFLGDRGEGRDWLLTLLEARKAMYELRYELEYRPGWAEIPAAAIPVLAGQL